MPFRNSIVSAVISTALSGARVLIQQFGSAGGVVQFFTGQATETEPAQISGSWQSNPFNRYVLTLRGAVGTSPALDPPPQIQLAHQEVSGDATITMLAEEFLLMLSGGGLPELRFGSASEPDVLGAWVPFTPVMTGSGVNPTLGASVWNCAYMKIGKTVHVRYRLDVGAGFAAGAGTYNITLPPGLPSTGINRDVGNMWAYNPTGPTFVIFIANTNPVNLVAGITAGLVAFGATHLGAVGSQWVCSMTYETP